MSLSNYQLVLLDNLIYWKSFKIKFDKAKEELEKNETNRGVMIRDVIYELIEDVKKVEKEQKTKEPENPKILLTCEMSKQEWLGILNAIASDDILRNLEIHDVQDNNSDENKSDNGFRAMTLVGTDENIIIFRGTTCGQEWIDNGQGGYSEITENQKDALEYVNNTDLVNNNPFVVSGHSKGGNLAQYVTLFATETLIDRCLNFDGQGFSEELCSTSKYQKALELNGDKLYTIASANDPVNVLLNAAVPDVYNCQPWGGNWKTISFS